MGKETNIKRLVVREIDEIIKPKSFNAHGLANAYIDGKFPAKLPFGFYYHLRTHEGIEKRLGKKTLSDLNNNYDRDTVEKVFEALLTFDVFLKKPDFDMENKRKVLQGIATF